MQARTVCFTCSDRTRTPPCRKRRTEGTADDEYNDLVPGGPPLLWCRALPPPPLAVQSSELEWLDSAKQRSDDGDRLDEGLQAARDIIAHGSEVQRSPLWLTGWCGIPVGAALPLLRFEPPSAKA